MTIDATQQGCARQPPYQHASDALIVVANLAEELAGACRETALGRLGPAPAADARLATLHDRAVTVAKTLENTRTRLREAAAAGGLDDE